MKETQSASLASQSFVFEQDAYVELKSYLDDVASRLPLTDCDTLEDVEFRFAEIFQEKLTSPMMVVTLRMVQEAIAQMGSPTAFGEKRHTSTEQSEPRAPRTGRLYRSLNDRSIAGVCGGLAAYFRIDPTMLRLVTLLLILFGGLSIWFYVILWILLPEEPLQGGTFQEGGR
ncbi:MAG: PspC domain-containing protein [Rikenellaceae bacterium]|nr:PspC domain-containing protein [Rikenellaceae bacterium]